MSSERGRHGLERLPSEVIELQKNPEQVFDSSREAARREYQDFICRIRDREIGREDFDRTTSLETYAEKGNSGGAPAIDIVWRKRRTATMLRLHPIVEGHGPEKETFGFIGKYGAAQKTDRGGNEFVDKPESLESLYGAPSWCRFIVKPTVGRFAVGRSVLTEIHGQNACELYLGVGFLLLDQAWMHVGMHEAGHLPPTIKGTSNDENTAWSLGNAVAAVKNRSHKDRLVTGKSSGLFGVYRDPKKERYADPVTVGKIVRYGLTSHALAGKAHIPSSWQRRANDTMRELNGEIERAYDKFEYFLR